MDLRPDILLAEDNISDAELFQMALQLNRSTSRLHIVRDGVHALNFLQGGSVSMSAGPGILPRLTLLDLNMPRIDGLEVLKQLRAHPGTRHLAVVIFSSSSETTDRDQARRLGANDYLRKPNQFSELCAVVAQLERVWLSGGKTG